ncbi:MAG TPA: glycosyltransferase family 9 protein [Thermomicrobiales bacterium]|nr:glycosyltransferase family 9 protein [Thermomicrobiales bacterium]
MSSSFPLALAATSSPSAWLEARNILVVRMDNAGDVVMLGPALRAVKETSPEARLTLLASPAGAAVAPLLPWVDDVITWRAIWQDLGQLPFDPAREQVLIDQLKGYGFDAALIFTSFSQNPHVPGYACYLAGIPLRAGESKEFGGRALTDELRGAPDDLHQVERNVRLVEALGFAVRDRRLSLVIPEAARAAVPHLLQRVSLDPVAPFVLLHPGASAAARRYPPERYGAVAGGLLKLGWPVLVTGTERETAILDEVSRSAPEARRLIGATSLAEYAALVERAALVICNNTLPMHLADALEKPTVVLYSGTELEEQWRPRFAPATLLRRPTPCHPCHLFACPIGLPCLDIPQDEVVKAARALLGPPPPGGEPEARQIPFQRRAGSSAPTRGLGARGDRIKRIAVLRALYLGDLLCATPALRALRARFPGAEITLIGLPWAKALVERLPSLERTAVFPGWPGLLEVPYEPSRTEAFLAEHRGRYDLAIQMHGSGQASNGFVAALGARHALGYRIGTDDRLDQVLEHDPDEHEIRRWLRLVAVLGAPDGDPRLELETTPADERRAAALLPMDGEGPLVGLHPGAKDPERRWPVERFAALGDALAARHGARLVLTGTEGEREIVTAVREEMRAPALDLAGQTDLGAFAAAIRRLDLLVTNDTGASHLAAALGTPSVVLFGPTRPAHWAPLDADRHRVIDAAALAGPDVDPGEALARLEPGPVLAACAVQLGGCWPAAPRPAWEVSCAG